jgi:hypothetical protein
MFTTIEMMRLERRMSPLEALVAGILVNETQAAEVRAQLFAITQVGVSELHTIRSRDRFPSGTGHPGRPVPGMRVRKNLVVRLYGCPVVRWPNSRRSSSPSRRWACMSSIQPVIAKAH